MNYSQKDIASILAAMEREIASFPPPMSELIIRDYGKDPYLILISCLLSLRSRDAATYAVSKALFAYAQTPHDMVRMPVAKLEMILKPIGFYKRKAEIVQQVSRDLIERFAGVVPETEPELLSIKHIGRKTANLVLSMAFNKPALCVDTHVHRIANHMGLVSTKTATETEFALRELIPEVWWGRLNYLFVVWGQNVCKPLSKNCYCIKFLQKIYINRP